MEDILWTTRDKEMGMIDTDYGNSISEQIEIQSVMYRLVLERSRDLDFKPKKFYIHDKLVSVTGRRSHRWV